MRHWLSRLMIAIWAGQQPLATWMAPEGASGRALAQGGPLGRLFMQLLAVFVIVALIDSFACDLLRRSLPTVHYRHLGFMLICMVLFMLAGIVGAHAGFWAALPYALPGFFAAVVIWPDMISRHSGRLHQ